MALVALEIAVSILTLWQRDVAPGSIHVAVFVPSHVAVFAGHVLRGVDDVVEGGLGEVLGDRLDLVGILPQTRRI